LLVVGTLKAQLNQDMRAAMKARDETTTATLRMTMAAVRSAEVSGKAARELSDDEVLGIIAKEARKRREAAEAYDAAGRTELADKERAEQQVLARYLPEPLSDDELSELVAGALAQGGFSGMQAMGPAMKAVQAVVAGRAEGARVAAEVKRQLAG
jgi:uncharacterized protein